MPRAKKVAPRLDASAWIAAALTALAEKGVSAVAVEPIARSLGVTKGSFYWHFVDREALLQAAAEAWEASSTEGVITEVTKIAEPRQRLLKLLEVAHQSERGVRLTRAMSSLADHPSIGPLVKRVAARRVAFLVHCYEELGQKPRDAMESARLIYAAFLGLGELPALGLGFRSSEERTRSTVRLAELFVPTVT